MIGENATVINIQSLHIILYQTHTSPSPNIWIVKAKNKILSQA